MSADADFFEKIRRKYFTKKVFCDTINLILGFRNFVENPVKKSEKE